MLAGDIVQVGDVSLHDDGAHHMAVILDLIGDECAALFFTSNPNWSEKSRRATREELAMAGFVSSRPTYLAYVKRPRWDFTPLGLTFPTHWVEALKQEFCTVETVIQVHG